MKAADLTEKKNVEINISGEFLNESDQQFNTQRWSSNRKQEFKENISMHTPSTTTNQKALNQSHRFRSKTYLKENQQKQNSIQQTQNQQQQQSPVQNCGIKKKIGGLYSSREIISNNNINNNSELSERDVFQQRKQLHQIGNLKNHLQQPQKESDGVNGQIQKVRQKHNNKTMEITTMNNIHLHSFNESMQNYDFQEHNIKSHFAENVNSNYHSKSSQEDNNKMQNFLQLQQQQSKPTHRNTNTEDLQMQKSQSHLKFDTFQDQSHFHQQQQQNYFSQQKGEDQLMFTQRNFTTRNQESPFGEKDPSKYNNMTSRFQTERSQEKYPQQQQQQRGLISSQSSKDLSFLNHQKNQSSQNRKFEQNNLNIKDSNKQQQSIKQCYSSQQFVSKKPNKGQLLNISDEFHNEEEISPQFNKGLSTLAYNNNNGNSQKNLLRRSENNSLKSQQQKQQQQHLEQSDDNRNYLSFGKQNQKKNQEINNQNNHHEGKNSNFFSEKETKDNSEQRGQSSTSKQTINSSVANSNFKDLFEEKKSEIWCNQSQISYNTNTNTNAKNSNSKNSANQSNNNNNNNNLKNVQSNVNNGSSSNNFFTASHQTTNLNDETFSHQNCSQQLEENSDKDKLLGMLKRQMKLNEELEQSLTEKDKQNLELQEKLYKLQRKEEGHGKQIQELGNKNEQFQREILELQRELTRLEDLHNKTLEEKEKYFDWYEQEKQLNQQFSIALDELQTQCQQQQQQHQMEKLNQNNILPNSDQKREEGEAPDCLRKIILELSEILQVENLDDIVPHIQEILNLNKTNNKFIRSISDLTVKCSPEGYFKQQPTIKQIWKFIKKMVEDYISLKQSKSQNCSGGEKEIIQLVTKYLEVETNKEIIPEIYKLQQINKSQKQIINLIKQLYQIDKYTDEQELKNFLESELELSRRSSSNERFTQSNFSCNQ